MKLSFESLIIFVQNVDLLKHFYVDILELQVIEEQQSQWLLLKVGNCNVGLHKIGEQFSGENQGPYKFDNNTKTVFEIDENIHVVRNALLEKNVILKEVVTWDNYGYWICDGEDPEGNIFQLKQKKQHINCQPRQIPTQQIEAPCKQYDDIVQNWKRQARKIKLSEG